MLIKLTSAIGKKVFLVNNNIIDDVVVNNKGITMVYLSKAIRADGEYQELSVFAVEETPEDIYKQQTETCYPSL